MTTEQSAEKKLLTSGGTVRRRQFRSTGHTMSSTFTSGRIISTFALLTVLVSVAGVGLLAFVCAPVALLVPRRQRPVARCRRRLSGA